MADKAIDALTEATTIGSGDLFVTQQSAQAKKVTWETLINYLATALDGHGGINSIVLTGTNNLVDTYTITYADETTGTFTVTNGRGISGVAKTGTSGLVDTYAITYNDGATSAFDVTNGRGISSIVWTTSGTAGDGQEHIGTITYTDGTTSTVTLLDGYKGDTGEASYTHIRYADNEPTSDSDMGTSPADWIGFYSGLSETAPTAYTSYSWYKIKGETGATGNGISSIVKTETSGVVDTYTITYTDGTTSTFTVTNGSSIASIAYGSSSGLVDTYIITLTDGSTTSFTVTNAKSIASVQMVSGTHAAGTSDTYRITYNDGDTFDFSVYNGTNGTGSVSTVSGIQPVNGDVPQIVTGNAAPTTSTVGIENQIYINLNDGALYICTGETSGSYDWLSVGAITVDSALSTSSNNPVRNSVITSKIGTSSLDTTATNLSDAVNELNTKEGALASLTTPSNSSLVTAINSVYSAIPASLGMDVFEESSVATNSSKVLTIENQTKAVLFAIGAGAAAKAMWIVNATASGGVTISAVFGGGTNITTTTGTNSLTIANSSGVAIYLAALVFNGGVS